jgi:hypothetical protein
MNQGDPHPGRQLGSGPHLNSHLLDVDSLDQRSGRADEDTSGNGHRVHVA